MKSWRFWTSAGSVPLWAAAAVLAWACWDWTANRAIASELARLQDSGQPVRNVQCAPPGIPDADNAALLYVRALPLFTETSRPVEEFATDWTKPPTASVRDGARTWVSRNGYPLRLIREGTRRSAARWPMDWSRGVAMSFPSLLGCRRVVQLLGASAPLAADDGRLGEAEECLVTALRFARALDVEPVLIIQMIGISIDMMAADIAQGLLGRGIVPGAALRAETARVTEDAARRGMLGRCFAADRAAIIDAVLRDGLTTLATELRTPSWIAVAAVPYFKHDLAHYSRSMQILIDAAEGRRENDAALEQDVQEAMEAGGIISKTAIPGVSKTIEATQSGASRRHLLRIAVEGACEPRIGGKWPATWPALGDSIDPFSGKPFRLIATEKEILIYGVGRDRVDDGGHPTKDETFRFAR